MVRIVADNALRPQRDGMRVLELTTGSEEQFGGLDSVRINPFMNSTEPLWPLDPALAGFSA